MVTQSVVLVPTEFNEPVVPDSVVEQPTVSATDTHTVSMFDPSEVHVQDIVDLLPKVKGSGALFDTNCWVYMYLLDKGKQPQFAYVSRPFIHVNSVTSFCTR